MYNIYRDIFGPGSNAAKRIVRDYGDMTKRMAACRELGLTIVQTSGTYDLYHEGHSRYLERAKEHGDVLIVGVDNDEKVRTRKGKNRPIVSEEERMEILCHCRHVDLVFLKKLGDPKWQLIKTVRPDVLIAVEGTYNEEQFEALKEFCREVKVLQPQGATSTTARIRTMLINHISEVRTKLAEVQKALEEIGGSGG